MSQDKHFGKVMISVPFGDLIDKLTILEIKQELLNGEGKLENVLREMDALRQDLARSNLSVASDLVDSLRDTNRKIFLLMEEIFTKELDEGQYAKISKETVDLNIVRANVKKEINARSGSSLTEEKSFFA